MHTKGPWRAIKRKLPEHPSEENDFLIVAEYEEDPTCPLHVAEVFSYQELRQPKGPSEANARLIAAAPELLEVLQFLVNDIEWQNDSPSLKWIKKVISKVKDYN